MEKPSFYYTVAGNTSPLYNRSHFLFSRHILSFTLSLKFRVGDKKMIEPWECKDGWEQRVFGENWQSAPLNLIAWLDVHRQKKRPPEWNAQSVKIWKLRCSPCGIKLENAFAGVQVLHLSLAGSEELRDSDTSMETC